MSAQTPWQDARSFPLEVSIVEVGPRDGLQNEVLPLPVHSKIDLIEDLAAAGLRRIECGSFVAPHRVPQMADTRLVFAELARLDNVSYSALVPNLHGFEQAVACNVNEIAVFVAASEAFSQANLNCSIEESLRKAQSVIHAAREKGIAVRGYVSCALGCPFAGKVAPAPVSRVAKALFELGCYEISLGDTIGVGTPLQTSHMLEAVAGEIPLKSIAVHFHDTWGQALANVLVSLELGVAVIDSSVGGLGGCPFAPGAAGNLATEDLLYMLDGMGIATGVDLARVAAAGRKIFSLLGKKPASKVAAALEAGPH